MALIQPEPDLTDGVVRLRAWSVGDVGCIMGTASDARIRRGTTVPAIVTPGSGLAFIGRQRHRLRHGEGLSLAVTDFDGDRALGCAVLMVRSRPGVVGVGYWILPRARHHGFATRSVRLLSDWALHDRRMARVEALVEPVNLASRRVVAAAGSVEEGLLPDFLPFTDGPADALLFARERTSESRWPRRARRP